MGLITALVRFRCRASTFKVIRSPLLFKDLPKLDRRLVAEQGLGAHGHEATFFQRSGDPRVVKSFKGIDTTSGAHRAIARLLSPSCQVH